MSEKSRSKASKSMKGSKPDPDLMERLKHFVRRIQAEYLSDPNITSVGIGIKRSVNPETSIEEPTGEISIQFTVGTKAQPEALGNLNTRMIPSSFEVDGIEVKTDVLERTYRPAYRTITAESANSRKTRLDPVPPGCSVGNFRSSAGTLGCFVYDRKTGQPYILSNWHVLHGAGGNVGDDVVQPGTVDDNRVQQNRVGELVRSYIGVAGDCAIASFQDRTPEAEILDLKVIPDSIGEPEIDDIVLKSGRTTDVTRGRVTRVNTAAKIDYGGTVGQVSVGCFEIEPLPGDQGEISAPGDSGSLWVFGSSDGKASKVAAGLHFAGEGLGDPHEHALACYMSSVFEKLEVSINPPAEETIIRRLEQSGYDENFLGVPVGLPILGASQSDAFIRNGSEIVRYTHFSLALSKSRRFAIWVAWNIDGSSMKKVSRKGIPFVIDPNIPAKYQADDSLYSGNRLDRGHIARRADLCWGAMAEAKKANIDSFFFTNITPQMDDFNQSSKAGIWGKLEDAVFSDVDVQNLRVSVFGGPVFQEDDRLFRGIRVPREFFKVIVFVERGELRARGFLLTQNLNQLEALELDEFRVYQVALSEVEARCKFAFPEVLRGADALGARLARRPETLIERPALESVSEIEW